MEEVAKIHIHCTKVCSPGLPSHRHTHTLSTHYPHTTFLRASPPYLLVRLATDLLGEERALLTSSRRLGEPPELDVLPSSPDPELELQLLELELLVLMYMRPES